MLGARWQSVTRFASNGLQISTKPFCHGKFRDELFR
jgi:hypothetical protein